MPSSSQPGQHIVPSRRESKPKVVIVGAGFGGLSAAAGLAAAPVEVTLIDRCNHHLFQPLLYQVATAGLSPADIAWPVRSILRKQANVKVLLGEVSTVDRNEKLVHFNDDAIPYDYLVLATGARHSYFGNEHWAQYAHGLKRIEDATHIRRQVLLAFEYAEMESDPVKRMQLLSFVIVGAGPTGVELAGALIELSRKALAKDFRNIDPRQARIMLIEAGDRVLPGFPEPLSAFARKALQKLGVEVRLSDPVTLCDGDGVSLGSERIAASTVLWAAGVAASPAGQWLGVECDQAGRIYVNPDLSIPGLSEVYAIGDTIVVNDKNGNPLPGVAPVAKQQGRHVAARIEAAVTGEDKGTPFRYRSMGNLATIGRKAAVIDFGFVQLKGWFAWWIWGVAHVYFLIGMRNRVLVAIQWLWSYFTFQSGGRLITNPDN